MTGPGVVAGTRTALTRRVSLIPRVPPSRPAVPGRIRDGGNLARWNRAGNLGNGRRGVGGREKGHLETSGAEHWRGEDLRFEQVRTRRVCGELWIWDRRFSVFFYAS
jgi:hypothetical protein